MNLELLPATEATERFYGKWERGLSSNCVVNLDGTITYHAVEGFTSPLKQLSTATKDAETMTEDEGSLTDYNCDVDSHIYTNTISGSLIAKILIEKFQRRKDVRRISFLIENGRRQLSVYANMRDNCIHCTISTASYTLTRQLTLEKREMVIAIREGLRMHSYISILDENVFC